MLEVSQKQDEDEESKEDIAGPGAEGGKREEQIAKDAAAKQGKQIEDGFAEGKLPTHFAYCCYRQHQQNPDGAKEEAQDEGQVEGIERGMIVIEHPCLGDVMLDAGIE